jgi:hypothetical protein
MIESRSTDAQYAPIQRFNDRKVERFLTLNG